MFVGHYGVALAARPLAPGVSLGILFVATQLQDILFSVLLLLGIEHVRLHPGVPGPSGVEMVSVAFSHSAVAALVLSAAVLGIAWAVGRGERRERLQAACVLAAVVASHYLLDIVVHDSSIPVISHHGEVGLGVPMAAGVILESALLLIGLAIYLRTTTARTRLGRFGPPLLTLGLVGFNAYVAVTPAPGGVTGLALSNLGAYVVLAALYFWLDRHRTPRRHGPRRPERIAATSS